ncbi:J domain-containing protein [Desulfomarina sp.]
MYLATRHLPSTRYQLRHSVEVDEDKFQSVPVYDLGENPADHFEIYEEQVVLFSEKLLKSVETWCPGKAENLLEELLRPFFPEEIRFRTQPFHNRRTRKTALPGDNNRRAVASQVHEFDRRRLYFLRYGAVDQARLHRLHEKCCFPLLGQSRDEREQFFAGEEQAVSPGEYLRYLHATLQLHRFFDESFAPSFPEPLDRATLCNHFIEQLCALNRDASFWQLESEAPEENSLHPLLVRYLIMFFDHQPQARSFSSDFARRFMGNHRRFHWPKQTRKKQKEAAALFGKPLDELRKLDQNELSRLFRKRAKKLHPDHGGNPGQFIDLTELYNELSAKS